jgi:peptidyl-prolyl cis-trans isomerase B (cyclophilin B)
MKFPLLFSTLVSSVALVGALAAAAPAAPAVAPVPVPAAPAVKDIRIVMTTSKGEIALTVFASKAPMTAANFLNLAQKGFYNGLTFHRVIADFMIQGGDPLGTGTGSPGYRFGDETRRDLKLDKPGVLAMANADQGKQAYSNTGNTNGSQFFITHVATPHLDGMHTVFGQVTKGQDVVNRIAMGDKITKIEILDPTADLFKAQADNLAKWNAVLKK